MQSRIPPESDSTQKADTRTDYEQRSSDAERRGADRRGEDRRRSAKGLFELRARRDRVVEDRRQNERRTLGRFRLAFWRRGSA